MNADSSRSDDVVRDPAKSTCEAMVLLIAVVIALFVPWPANLVVIILGVVGEIGEVIWGRRLARRWRPKTGAEAMIGQPAEVVSRLHPTGQVHVNGELWEARSTAYADVGDTVTVRALDGLTLLVEPASGQGSSQRDDEGGQRFQFANGTDKRKETHGNK
jgi:membrane protein implicated in regulation of membrane protease activity